MLKLLRPYVITAIVFNLALYLCGFYITGAIVSLFLIIAALKINHEIAFLRATDPRFDLYFKQRKR